MRLHPQAKCLFVESLGAGAPSGDAFFTHFDAPVINLLTVASTFWGSQRKVPPPTPSPSADVNAVNANVA